MTSCFCHCLKRQLQTGVFTLSTPNKGIRMLQYETLFFKMLDLRTIKYTQKQEVTLHSL